MVSVIGSFYTLSACLDQMPYNADQWRSFNEWQKLYLSKYAGMRNVDIPEIESRVSQGDVDPINQFLKDRGFDIQLQPIGPMDLAIASVLEVLLKWLREGEKFPLRHDNLLYKGVYLKEGVVVNSVDEFWNPVAIITTENGDRVHMVVPNDKPRNSFEVLQVAEKLLENGRRYDSRYENVKFPMVDLKINTSLDWIVGMMDVTNNYEISEALQQTIVKMDEKGVLIKEAVAITARCCCVDFSEPVPLVIDKPFLFVVEREGLKEPFFAAYIDIDGWIIK